MGSHLHIATCYRTSQVMPWIFPISFKPKVAIAEIFWKMQRKAWYSILGVEAMPLSLKDLLLSCFYFRIS